MIEYDNSESPIRLILKWTGSPYSGIVIYCVIACVIAALFVYIDFLNEHLILEKPFALQIYGTILGYMVVFRTNMALQRYWEGLTSLRQMTGKWSDAFSLLVSFSNATLTSVDGDNEELRVRSKEFIYKIMHWFTLASAIGMHALENPSGEAEDIAQHPQFLYREPKRRQAMESSPEGNNSVVEGEDEECYYEVIGHLSAHERATLQSGDDILLVCQWITEGIAMATTGNLPLINIPPPILSRVFQEISMGMLGFNQSWKIAMVPFPFAFAQMMSLLILGIVFLMPMEISYSLDRWAPAMLFATLCVVGFTGLNRICVELEEPFGDDPNDIPIQQMQRKFVQRLEEIVMGSEPSDSGAPSLPLFMRGREAGVEDVGGDQQQKSGVVLAVNKLLQDMYEDDAFQLPSWVDEDDLLVYCRQAAAQSTRFECIGCRPLEDPDCELVVLRFIQESLKEAGKAVYTGAEIAENKQRNERSDADSEIKSDTPGRIKHRGRGRGRRNRSAPSSRNERMKIRAELVNKEKRVVELVRGLKDVIAEIYTLRAASVPPHRRGRRRRNNDAGSRSGTERNSDGAEQGPGPSTAATLDGMLNASEQFGRVVDCNRSGMVFESAI